MYIGFVPLYIARYRLWVSEERSDAGRHDALRKPPRNIVKAVIPFVLGHIVGQARRLELALKQINLVEKDYDAVERPRITNSIQLRRQQTHVDRANHWLLTTLWKTVRSRRKFYMERRGETHAAPLRSFC